ncbi:hypothetical protein [Glaciihabitans sp. dw_435]|uniref:hypothetical protein n=1 Tax=Glaciihabitans sp. dw_435 TaxID=2720081 RepID=UPI001BD49FE8|nr:hypothetical protein [Glaciihabitans sp. dw_435]
MKNRTRRGIAVLASAVLVAGVTATAAPAFASVSQSVPAAAASARLTNLAHLDFLLDTATPAALPDHTTYKLDTAPAITMPWTYADARDGGTFARVGGGPLDPATGHWGQGSYNVDDIARAAVVYLRDWKQTGSAASKQKAYELLRSVAYFQTTTGPNAGNVVLWMQPDGTLNPSPVPVELPNPSDSGDSYWLARSIWAFGEGYAAFQKQDPAFASFLQQRLQLGVTALNRESLSKYGKWNIADGTRVPAWLIVDGADASAEAVLGLSAYSAAVPRDTQARTALSELSEGIAAMSSGATQSWPYGAILPWAQSRSMWHAWSSQMPAALAEASTVLKKKSLLAPAVTDSVSFTTTLLTSGGPDNAWYPTPIDTTQIAYGVDSRLQSLLAVADVGRLPGLRQVAAVAASWYFGANKSGEPVYNPATGVTFDGVQADGTVNHNSGAESTIHGLLSMLALDAHPDVKAAAQATTHITTTDGIRVVEAESAAPTTGTVVTPASAWTGESQYSGGAYLALTAGQSATIALGATDQSVARLVEPVVFQPEVVRGSGTAATSRWSIWPNAAGPATLGSLRHAVGAQGITEVPGALLPQSLRRPVPAGATSVTVVGTAGTVNLDALIVRPVVSRLVLTGAAGATTELVHSAATTRTRTVVGTAGTRSVVRSYDSHGKLVQTKSVARATSITLQAGGFAVLTGATR